MSQTTKCVLQIKHNENNIHTIGKNSFEDARAIMRQLLEALFPSKSYKQIKEDAIRYNENLFVVMHNGTKVEYSIIPYHNYLFNEFSQCNHIEDVITSVNAELLRKVEDKYKDTVFIERKGRPIHQIGVLEENPESMFSKTIAYVDRIPNVFYYICSNCGHNFGNEPAFECPHCNAVLHSELN